MKKLFALVLALCLLGSCAFADGQLVWEGEIAEAAAAYEGEFHTLNEVSAKIWIPAEFEEAELDEEQKEDGTIAAFVTEDDAAIVVQYVDMEGMTLEQYQAELEGSDDVTELEAGTVNGIPCLSYEYNGNGVLAFTTEMGYILEVAFGPLSNEEYKTKASFALASIQSAD